MTIDLSTYRNRRSAAMACHPSVTPIWTPEDAVDTAQAFAAEIDQAECGQRHCTRCGLSHLSVRIDPDGVCRRCKAAEKVCCCPPAEEPIRPLESQNRTGLGSRWLFSRSRFRRAAVLDGLAVALLMAVMAAVGCLVVLAGAR